MRSKPYTKIGIRRLKCFRCGARAEYQWQVCADKNIWRPICPVCDVMLNQIVLQFMHDPLWKNKIDKYKEKVKCHSNQD